MRIEPINGYWGITIFDEWEERFLQYLQCDIGKEHLVNIGENRYALLLEGESNPEQLLQDFAEDLDNMTKYIHYFLLPQIRRRSND